MGQITINGRVVYTRTVSTLKNRCDVIDNVMCGIAISKLRNKSRDHYIVYNHKDTIGKKGWDDVIVIAEYESSVDRLTVDQVQLANIEITSTRLLNSLRMIAQRCDKNQE